MDEGATVPLRLRTRRGLSSDAVRRHPPDTSGRSRPASYIPLQLYSSTWRNPSLFRSSRKEEKTNNCNMQTTGLLKRSNIFNQQKIPWQIIFFVFWKLCSLHVIVFFIFLTKIYICTSRVVKSVQKLWNPFWPFQIIMVNKLLLVSSTHSSWNWKESKSPIIPMLQWHILDIYYS